MRSKVVRKKVSRKMDVKFMRNKVKFSACKCVHFICVMYFIATAIRQRIDIPPSLFNELIIVK